MNIQYIYFISPVQIRDKNATKNQHVISSDRAEIEVKDQFVYITVHGFVSVIPMSNISSMVLHK